MIRLDAVTGVEDAGAGVALVSPPLVSGSVSSRGIAMGKGGMILDSGAITAVVALVLTGESDGKEGDALSADEDTVVSLEMEDAGSLGVLSVTSGDDGDVVGEVD